MRSFVKLSSSRKVAITLSFTDIYKSCQSREFQNVANMSFNVFFHKNKILAKIFKFTVCILYQNHNHSYNHSTFSFANNKQRRIQRLFMGFA